MNSLAESFESFFKLEEHNDALFEVDVIDIDPQTREVFPVNSLAKLDARRQLGLIRQLLE